MRNKNNPGLYEQDDLSPQDLLNIQHPMITMPDGTKRIACTECHQRPLKVARLCQECYDERMEEAEWRSRLNIVRRGKSKPKLKCPWCHKVEKHSLESIDACCGKMHVALMQVQGEEYAYEKSVRFVNGEKTL